MNKPSKIIALAVSLFILSACVQVPNDKTPNKSQLALSSVRDLPITYPPQSTFSLSPRYLKKISLKPEQQKSIYRWYHQAIINNLQNHQFVQTSNKISARFYVGFGLALSEDFNDQDIVEKFGVTPGLYATQQYEKGSFLIYIDDAVTGKRVWRGAVQGFVQENLTKQARLARIDSVVDMVLKQFYSQND